MKIEKKVDELNRIIEKLVKYSRSFRKSSCYLTNSKDVIIIEQEMKNINFPNFITKIPIHDIDNVIIRERSRLAVHENYNNQKIKS